MLPRISLDDPFVVTFVATAEDHQTLRSGKLFQVALLQFLPARARQQEFRSFRRRLSLRDPQHIEGAKNRLRFQQHSRTSPVRSVVNGSMTVFTERAKIGHPDLNFALLPGHPHHSVLEKLIKEMRKDRQNVDLHPILRTVLAQEPPCAFFLARWTARRLFFPWGQLTSTLRRKDVTVALGRAPWSIQCWTRST